MTLYVGRPLAAPTKGMIPPFDAGWYAHEVGLARDTVRVLAADPSWALLGWDMRDTVVKYQERGKSHDAGSADHS